MPGRRRRRERRVRERVGYVPRPPPRSSIISSDSRQTRPEAISSEHGAPVHRCPQPSAVITRRDAPTDTRPDGAVRCIDNSCVLMSHPPETPPNTYQRKSVLSPMHAPRAYRTNSRSSSETAASRTQQCKTRQTNQRETQRILASEYYRAFKRAPCLQIL